MPPGLDVTVYSVIALPPSEAGAVNVIVACSLPPETLSIVGAPGRVMGVTALDAAEAAPVPIEFVAFTVKV